MCYLSREYSRLKHSGQRAEKLRLMLFGLRLPQECTGNVLEQEVEPDSLACCRPPSMQEVLELVLVFFMSTGDCFGING